MPHSNQRPQHRVVVTGIGALTNLGPDAPSTWDAMREGRSGISPIEGPAFDDYPDAKWACTIGGQVKHTDPDDLLDRKEAKRLDRCTKLGLVAADEAVKHSGIDFKAEDPERCGVIIGSGVGGISTIEESVRVLVKRGPDRINPFTVPRLMVNAISGNVSIRYGLEGRRPRTRPPAPARGTRSVTRCSTCVADSRT